MGAFGDGDEHDIHDADTANNDRDTSDDGEHARNKGEETTGGMGDLVAVRDGEIGIAGFRFGKGGADGIRGRFKSVGSGDFDVDLLELERFVEFFEAIDMNEDGAIEVDIVEINRIINAGEDAGDDEFCAFNGESLADGVGRTEEL